MFSLYNTLVQIIVDRERTEQAEARRLYEITKMQYRALLLKKATEILSDVLPLVTYDLNQVIFDPTCDTWRLEVGGVEFSQIMNNPTNIGAMLLPPYCTQGCAEWIYTTHDLIMLVSRHLSFPDHAEAPRQHAA